ncbi:MAG: hypothetical protein KF724_05745 [Phycisphaeraceae bacterium]|nr:hypothetical protein [Phycisphaeraceae bacterium]
MSKYLTAPVPSTRMPSGIPFIIGNEAAERFSFYGMKAILVVFMTQYLTSSSGQPSPMEASEARQAMALFTAGAYFFPILGALVADAILGKYLTIMLLSIVYCIGHLALALMDMPPAALEATMEPRTWLFIGLFLIAVGSGGIKPCVSAHVGDQFGESNKGLLSRVYGWFYFSINFGSLFSTLLTPWILDRKGPDVIIGGPAWAFGIPGILMAIATLCFWAGRKRFVHIPPRGLDFVRETFLSREGLTVIAKLVPVYLFVAVFWALYDQTGSAWVQQAQTMDRRFMGMLLLESQVQAVNPLLILILIPIFTYLIYPALGKVITLTPIRKIAIGFFITIASFALAAMVEGRIGDAQARFKPLVESALRSGEIDLAKTREAAAQAGHDGAADRIRRLGGAPLLFVPREAIVPGEAQRTATPLSLTLRSEQGEVTVDAPAGVSMGRIRQIVREAVRSSAKDPAIAVSVMDGTGEGERVRVVAGTVFEEQARAGRTVAQLAEALRDLGEPPAGWSEAEVGLLEATLLGGLLFEGDSIGEDAWISVEIRRPDGSLIEGIDLWSDQAVREARGVALERAVSQALVSTITQAGVLETRTGFIRSEVPNISWQLLAFLIITAAEVMVSITCLEFSYTQAPRQMKSFVMGLFLLSVSAGNGIIYLVNRFTTDPLTGVSSLEGPSYYWFFTWMMAASSLAFLVVVRLYRSRDYLQEERSVSEQRARGDGAALEG